MNTLKAIEFKAINPIKAQGTIQSRYGLGMGLLMKLLVISQGIFKNLWVFFE
jgi:hypothetical protein